MNKTLPAIALTALTSALSIGTVAAEEETLKFRLIVRPINETVLEAPVAGRSVSVGQYAGVAVFEDGRLADKQFVDISDSSENEGTYSGYSVYTFQNGDTLTLKYTGGWGADGGGGDYEVLSGTGAYEGATGTGHFEMLEDPWEKAHLLDVTINVTRGDS